MSTQGWGTAVEAFADSKECHITLENLPSIQHLCHRSPGGWGVPVWSGGSTNALKMQNTGTESHSRDRSSFRSFPGERGNLCSPTLWGINPPKETSGVTASAPPLSPPSSDRRGPEHLSVPHCSPWLGWFDVSFLPSLCVVISGQGKVRPSVGVWNVNNYN